MTVSDVGRPSIGHATGTMNYELACLVERLLFSGTFLLPGAFSIQAITAPSASHAAQMGSSPQPTTGPGLPQVLLGCVGSTGPLPASQPLAAPKARTISATPAIQLPIHAHHRMPSRALSCRTGSDRRPALR